MSYASKIQALKNLAKPILEPIQEGYQEALDYAEQLQDDETKKRIDLVNSNLKEAGKPELTEEQKEVYKNIPGMAMNIGTSAGNINIVKGIPKAAESLGSKLKNLWYKSKPVAEEAAEKTVITKVEPITDEVKALSKKLDDAEKIKELNIDVNNPQNASEEAIIEESLKRLKDNYSPEIAPIRSESIPKKELVIERLNENKTSWERGAPVAESTPTPTEDLIRSKDYYHGTDVDINKYKNIKPGDTAKGVMESPSDAVFFGDADTGSEFAMARGSDKNTPARVYKNVISPENTFNPKDPAKVEQLKKALVNSGVDDEVYIATLSEELKDGKNNWMLMESPRMQKALKDAGFDSFYTTEAGKRNLGVLNTDIVEQALTKSQRKEALKAIKQRKLNEYLDKISKSEKEYSEELGKKFD